MLKLDATLQRRRRLVLVVWAIVIVAALPFAARQSERLTGGGFDAPGSGSQSVQDALDRDFANAQQQRLAIVLVARGGATEADARAALARAREAVQRTDRVALAAAASRAAPRPGARTVILPLRVSTSEWQTVDVAKELRKNLGLGTSRATQRGVTAYLIGQGALYAGVQDISKTDLQQAESVGFPLVALILLVVFGSLAAAVLPLALGFVSVLVTGALIWLVSQTMEMSIFTTNMASMIGIGVAVDYSLFILARYREEIATGREPDDARARALSTSGVAVVFSGLTVIAALSGLLLIDTTALRSMALGAILVVAVSVLAASTLLPVLIALVGRRVTRPGRVLSAIGGLMRRALPRRRTARRGPFWERWTSFVMGRPVVAIVASAGVLLALAVPALSLQTANGALRQFPAGNEVRVGFEAAAAQQGPGALTPVMILARPQHGRVDDARNAPAVRELRAALARDPAVARVAGPVDSLDRRSVLISATPRSDGESTATVALVRRLRERLPAASPLQIEIGGSTAAIRDFDDRVTGSLWKIALFVLSLSFMVLLVLLRSVVLPLKAVVMNLLTVGAALGVVVAVFQWGWVDGFLGFQSPGYVDTLTPPLVLAVVFGLSMDYEVFLLSRIKERYTATRDTRAAVAGGLSSSARTISSAALIMVVVFSVFVGTGLTSIQQIGLGNAAAIALDATLVRLVLVPASMAVLGRWNWWLPRPLARIFGGEGRGGPLPSTQ